MKRLIKKKEVKDNKVVTKKWLDKPYNNLNAYLRQRFGQKIIKLSVDGGFSCPNRDGNLSTGGCIFCSENGSGEFAGNRAESITKQLQDQITLLTPKWPEAKYIAYFQSYSNTYGQLDYMEKQFREALNHPSVVGLAIATRVDCLSDEVMGLLAQLNKETFLWVELGLQSIYDTHHTWLNTGYEPFQFEQAVKTLSAKEIEVVGHVILGLPKRPKAYILETAAFLNALPIKGLKIHMLNILKGTQLATLYEEKPFPLLESEDYIEEVVTLIEHLREDIVIHRVTGDGAKELLIAPRWILNKRKVLNDLLKAFKIKNTYQGKYTEKWR